MLSREELDALRIRVEQATPGPWMFGKIDGRWVLYNNGGAIPVNAGDADFLARAREDIPRLLETVETFARALAGYKSQPMRSRDVDDRCQFCGAIWHYFLNAEGRMREEGAGHAASCPVVQARALGY